jgi:Domain of unknown function (DUF5606)
MAPPQMNASFYLAALNVSIMEYSKLIAITGMGGLFELVTSKKDGAIVKSLEDKTTKFVSSRVHNFSHLESIEVYTKTDNVNLADVFKAMQADKTALPDDREAAAVKGYFEKVYPDMDFERVYNSDMKKMVKWLKQLNDNGVEIKLSEATEDAADDAAETPAAEPVAETAPEPAPEPAAEEAPAEKPKKKTARKKKEEG